MTRRDAFPAQGRMTVWSPDGREADQMHVCTWLHEDDYAELVRAALDEGCPPEALLAEVVHAWRIDREAANDAEVPLSIAESHVARRTRAEP